MRICLALARVGNDCQILIDGVDVSTYCTGVEVVAQATGVTRVTLDLVPLEVLVEGEAAEVVGRIRGGRDVPGPEASG